MCCFLLIFLWFLLIWSRTILESVWLCKIWVFVSLLYFLFLLPDANFSSTHFIRSFQFIYLYYPSLANTSLQGNTVLHPKPKKAHPYESPLVAFANIYNIFSVKCRSADFANKFTDLIFYFTRLTTEGLMRVGCNTKFMNLILLKLKNLF